MTSFEIAFSNPYLLLLLIPAIGVPLFLYFRIAKKYRRTRNRITSLVLHLVIMVLSVAVLSGMTFDYSVPNSENEVLLLVDVSFSGTQSSRDKNEFVKSVLDASSASFKVGVVTFGYGQVYAAPLTNDTDTVYDSYLNAALPDTSATDVASALGYARGLFEHPETAKIVLVTDGIETDGNAMAAVKSVAAEGIKVDTAYFPTSFDDDVQVIGITPPTDNIIVGEEFKLSVTLQSSLAGVASVTLYDNDTPFEPIFVNLEKGVQTVELLHKFDLPGMHKISFAVKSDDDNLNENNTYYSYIYLNVFDRILIVEGTNGESGRINDLLLKEDYKVTVVAASDVPETLDELREYDQVILSNVSNADLPEGFDEILHSYVYDVGGGLFTIGGNKTDAAGNPVLDAYGNPVPNAYNRNDLHNDDGSATLLQRMLPVQAVDYTPPIGLAIIIDYAGSMSSGDDSTGMPKLEAAKQGAMACLQVLSERDYCGVFGLSDKYSEELEITSMTNMSKIVETIDNLEGTGGTQYAPAIEYAGRALAALENVERRHMILITDGEPGDSKEKYINEIKRNYERPGKKTTITIISFGTSHAADMQEAAEAGGGNYYAGDAANLAVDMVNDLKMPEIQEIEYGEFQPRIVGNSTATSGIVQADMPSLYGFYGTKKKQDAITPLMGEYVPVYAQWQYGKGFVGSFMCDLNGTWSGDFLEDVNGQRFINNVVKSLFPLEDIRAKGVNVELKEDNYSTQLSIYTTLGETETLDVTITSPLAEGNTEPNVQRITSTANDNYSRVTFTNMLPGLYQIVVDKKDADGNVLAKYVGYKTFSYSEEYNVFVNTDDCKRFVADLATNGNGVSVEDDIMSIYADVQKELQRSFDPKLLFIILAIVLFLLDIAVRKFKFKWIHELVRERKEKKANNGEGRAQ